MKPLAKIRQDFNQHGPKCKLLGVSTQRLSDYFELLYGVTGTGRAFWFRGHDDLKWSLTPSALRFGDWAKRKRALTLWKEFKRIAETKLPNPQDHADALRWMQLAQHHGLPTRLLDWTQNAAIALYFACLDPTKNGVVFILNPLNLNRQADPRNPRVLDPHDDARIIQSYFELGPRTNPRGLPTVAINPLWNSERIILQKGTFTLHGSKVFALDEKQAPGLVCLPILAEHKERLRDELERVGVDEMSIFPEPEHIANYLRRKAGLS